MMMITSGTEQIARVSVTEDSFSLIARNMVKPRRIRSLETDAASLNIEQYVSVIILQAASSMVIIT